MNDAIQSRIKEIVTRPEPAPKEGDGESCHDIAIARMRELAVTSLSSYSYATACLESRKGLGLQKYGTVLQKGNGRDSLIDTAQELTDALAYLAQAGMEGTSIFSNTAQSLEEVVSIILLRDGHPT